MFRPNRTPPARRLSRRDFLRLGGASALGGLGTLYLAGCGAAPSAGAPESTIVRTNAVTAASSAEEKWRQYAGSKLVFLAENTPPTTGIKQLVERGDFQRLTGIEVQIVQAELPVLLQKASVDMRGGGAANHMVYNQDKPVGSVLADYFEDLTPYMRDETLPQDPDGYGEEVWYPGYLASSGYAYAQDRLISLPFDTAVSVFFYRYDLFERFSPQFEAEYGYPMVYTPETTWKQVLDFSRFFKEQHARDVSVPYGIGLHLGTFAWTTQLDIQRILYSHGQWLDFQGSDDIIGSKTPGKTNWGDAQSIRALELYKELFDSSTPDGLSLGLIEVNDAYRAGKLAMQVQYHEFAASVEDAANSAAAGRTAYDITPKGDPAYLASGGQLVNGTNFGVGGLAINTNASADLKRAAWIFAVWATSAAVQAENLALSGGTPTRLAVERDTRVANATGKPYGSSPAARVGPSDFPNAITFPAVRAGGVAPNAVIGPKIPRFNEYVTIIANEIQKLCAGQQGAEATARAIQTQVDSANGV